MQTYTSDAHTDVQLKYNSVESLLWAVVRTVSFHMKNPLKINMKLLRFSLQTELYGNVAISMGRGIKALI